MCFYISRYHLVSYTLTKENIVSFCCAKTT